MALETLPDDIILSHVDFAKNYGYQVATEVETKYFQSFQVTIMVHITFRVNMLMTRPNLRSLRNNTTGSTTILSMTPFLCNIASECIDDGCVPKGFAQKSTRCLAMDV